MTLFQKSARLSIGPQVRCQYSAVIWPLQRQKGQGRAKRSKNQVLKLRKQHQAIKNLEVSTYSNICSIINTTLAFASVTSGLGTGIRKAAPGPSAATSTDLQPAVVTSDPQPAMATSDAQPIVVTSDPQPAMPTSDPQPAASTSDPQPAVSTSDAQPTGVSAISEISTMHLIHVAATCRFRFSQRGKH